MKSWWERNKIFLLLLAPIIAFVVLLSSRQLMIFLSYAFSAQ